MEKIVDKQFVRELLDMIAIKTHCSIQHNGCPCNTCFHAWAKDIGLSNDVAHLFWIVVLALRGDCSDEELLRSNKENFEKIIVKFN